MGKTWYSDKSAEIAHFVMKEKLDPVCKELFPKHEFSLAGFNRDFDTGEIKVVLHLKPVTQKRIEE